MTNRLLTTLVMFTLTSSTAMADDEGPEGETPMEKDERIAGLAGHFAAGVRLHLASGPDGTEYKSLNFAELDLQARYNVSDLFTTYLNIPLSVKHPDGFETIGGGTVRGELKLGSTFAVGATVGMLRDGAFLLSEKDFPAWVGDLKFGTALGPSLRLKAGAAYLRIDPSFVYQTSDADANTGFQLPVTATLRVARMLRVSGDIGLYSGDDFKVSPSDGGRLGVGAAVDVQISSIALHLGAGFASLMTDDAGLYPSVGKSLFFDVALKYVK